MTVFAGDLVLKHQSSFLGREFSFLFEKLRTAIHEAFETK